MSSTDAPAAATPATTQHNTPLGSCALCFTRLSTMPMRCDCGGPQQGTSHAPDCRFVLDLDLLAEEHYDEVFDAAN